VAASGIEWTREAVCAACGSGQRLITATTAGVVISHCYMCGDSTTTRSESALAAAAPEVAGPDVDSQLDLFGHVSPPSPTSAMTDASAGGSISRN
jgi:hypothetical protein